MHALLDVAFVRVPRLHLETVLYIGKYIMHVLIWCDRQLPTALSQQTCFINKDMHGQLFWMNEDRN
jgi:hypothetical protein